MMKWHALAATIIFFFSVLVFLNISSYPQPTYDDGINVEIARNLLQHGKYAQTSLTDKEFNLLDNSITTGPTLTLPIIIALKIGGIHIHSGRWISAIYLVLLFILLYRFLLFKMSPKSAILVLLFFGTYPETLVLGRHVIGEIPSLFFFLCGLFFLERIVQFPSNKNFLAAGFFFGLTVLTKENYGLILGPLLLGLVIFQVFYDSKNRISWILFFFMFLIPDLLFNLYKFLVLGGKEFSEHLAERAKYRVEFWNPNLLSIQFLKNRIVFWFGFFYFLGQLFFAKNRGSWLRWFYFLFFTSWSLLYLVSIGWPRFALPVIFLGCVAAGMFCERIIKNDLFFFKSRKYIQFALFAVIIAILVDNGQFVLRFIKIIKGGEPDTYRVARMINKQVPKDAVIETNDPEVMVEAYPHPFHLAPQLFPGKDWIIQEPYPFLKMGWPYLLIGEKGSLRNIYPEQIINTHYQLVFKEGRYKLYRLLHP